METRVEHLSEALPYIQKYTGKFFVIKYGGSALLDDDMARLTIKDLILLNSVGIKTVLVHGGGPEINTMLTKIGKEIKFTNGLRKTDAETMEVVEMVLHGKIQRRIVSMINCSGALAIGLSGRDGRIMVAKPHPEAGSGNMVGELKSSNLELIYEILKLGLIPVLSSIAPDEDGNAYNINADTMAAELAIGMQAEKLLLMTDTPGVLLDKNNPNSLVPELNRNEASSFINNGTVSAGMIPKLECCIKAIDHGVNEAIILNGLEKHSLLLEVFTDKGAGTRVKR
jgi:acetylglutamate kinase